MTVVFFAHSILADLGLLEGRRRDFPGIEVVDDALYVDAGAFVTSAGSAAQSNGVVSSFSFVSTTNTARSLAGSVLLALALTR
ncbi:hypothetical protein SAMN05428966_10736 [Massilia sp. PDC64]|nr:hypothetical protein SAMN05428966_10736 [Massilia sp. PDC64]